MKTFYIETYGCQMNISDSESISGILIASGMEELESADHADLIIINTCVVRESAVTRVTARIGRFKPLKLKNRRIKVAVAGCLAQEKKEKLFKMIPFIDYVIGPDKYAFLAEIIADKSVHVSEENEGRDFYTEFEPTRKRGVYSWVPIMRGCNNFCSYCIVPYVRGREASKPLNVIISEIEKLVASGYSEVSLLGQNVNSYLDGSTNFPKLLHRLDKIDGLKRLRFMTSHPKDLSSELIDCFGELDSLCEYLHLPFQSGSNRILKAMNRGYTREQYIAIIEKLRKRIPNMSFSTDVLTCFPGETVAEHNETLSLVKEMNFDSAFMYMYSSREGTKAASITELMSREEKVARLNEVIVMQRDITQKKNKALIGSNQEVLVEALSTKDKNYLTSRTRTYKNVIFKGNESLVGKIVNTKITSSTGWALQAELIV